MRRQLDVAFEHRLQRAAGDVLHVQQPQRLLGQQPLIVHAHDVRMVELGHHLRLGPAVGRDLERHQPLHRDLPRQEHTGERPAAQPREQLKIVDRVAELERHLRRRGVHQGAGRVRTVQTQ